jgi:hypothetical protein
MKNYVPTTIVGVVVTALGTMTIVIPRAFKLYSDTFLLDCAGSFVLGLGALVTIIGIIFFLIDRT